jgi:hypothetical protein
MNKKNTNTQDRTGWWTETTRTGGTGLEKGHKLQCMQSYTRKLELHTENAELRRK